MIVKTYDPKSYELAEHFLNDDKSMNTTHNREALAAVIQSAVEDWMTYQEGPCYACGEARGVGDHSICHQMP